MNKQKIVLKIGGSILSPSEENIFNFQLAQKIRDSLLLHKDKYQFVAIIGGGALAKKYQKIVRENGGTDRDINWAGTSANNHNAVMTRVAFGDFAADKAITFNEIYVGNKVEFEEPFLLVGANEPGHSGDLDAVIMALNEDATTVISLKDIDGVYDADPDFNADAQKFDKLTWDKYRNEVLKTAEFTPKMAVPVDPIASKMAQENNINFIILDGNDLENLNKAINGEEFIGTTISNEV